MKRGTMITCIALTLALAACDGPVKNHRADRTQGTPGIQAYSYTIPDAPVRRSMKGQMRPVKTSFYPDHRVDFPSALTN